jgi:anti-sigma B factor antagonist/stage II sporulation protein AA (anti-sigma F factor antagonist)
MTEAELTVEPHDEGPVIAIGGDIDLSSADRVRDEIAAAVPHDAKGIVVDLTKTTYLDSTGVRLLFELAERLQARRQRLVLVVSEAALVRRVVVLTKLDDAVPMVETIDDALTALRTP